MKTEYRLTYKIVTPEEGKYLYNGEYTTTVIYAPLKATLDEWSEVDESFNEQLKQNEYEESRNTGIKGDSENN